MYGPPKPSRPWWEQNIQAIKLETDGLLMEYEAWQACKERRDLTENTGNDHHHAAHRHIIEIHTLLGALLISFKEKM